ncbi:glycerophosphodiester phosphodiesterase [uncultured Oxalicibacterium sp.]|uniref:glycerophosphodiester phosphodiesterase n=1 Tax=uncultured Oxalicibacterium sp. TaxID=1168540 RepID=UPI0025E3F9AB|nr:glycerophosphodiester phosphodiesterase [uncultured Oxalicibacterium sp.]
MWPYPRVVAHRGGGTLAPENTIAAMRCGLDRGYRGVEFDVMLTKDGIPVVMHDPELGRTVAGEGSIADFTVQELIVRDAGAWFGPEFEGEPVPTFEQVAAFCMQHGIWMNVEIKPVPGFEDRTGWVVAQTVQRLFAGLPDHRPAAMPLLSSFSFAALQAAQLAAPEVPRGLLIDDVPEDWHAQLRAIAAIALHINHLKLTPVLARAVKEAGFGLFCYTVNDPVRARQLLAWGVDGFCTDRLDLIGPDFADRPL